MKKIFTLGFMMLIASVMFGQEQITIDFEFDGVGADWTWGYCCNGAEGSVLEVVDNPSYDDVNESEKVATFTCRADGDAWALFLNGTDMGEFTFTEDNCIISLMVYKTIASDIGIKVEKGADNVTVVQANTVVDAWQEVSFDFTENIGESYTGLVIMPSLINRDEDVVVYVDNIIAPKGAVAETDTDADGTPDADDPDDDNDGNPDETDANPLVVTTASDVLTVIKGASITVNVLENDDFLPGDNISLVDSETGTAAGTVVLDPATGELTYTPLDSEGGTDVTVVYTVCNTDATPNVCKDETVTITVDFATSFGAIKADELVLYPNPVSDIVTIPNAQNGDLLKVYNIAGVLVKSITVKNGVVSLGDLVKGKYLVNVNGATVKIVKK